MPPTSPEWLGKTGDRQLDQEDFVIFCCANLFLLRLLRFNLSNLYREIQAHLSPNSMVHLLTLNVL